MNKTQTVLEYRYVSTYANNNTIIIAGLIRSIIHKSFYSIK